FGAWTGVRITLMPSLRKTLSKAWLNFGVAVVYEKPEWLLVAELHDQVAPLLGDPASVGMRRAGDVLDPPGRERDEEEHVDPLQAGGFDGEKVAGDHARRLRSQEGSPRRARSLRCWLETGLDKHLAHRGR